jgi:hypothetical protein
MIATKQRRSRQPKGPTDELAALEAEIAERQKRRATHQAKAREFAETARQAKREHMRSFQRAEAEHHAIQRLRRRREQIFDKRIATAPAVTHEAIRQLQEAKRHALEHLDGELQRDRECLTDVRRSGVQPDAGAVLPNQAPAELPRFAAALERRVKRGDFAERFRQQVDAALAGVREIQVSANGDTETALRKILAALPEQCDCGFNFNLNIEKAT